MEERFADEQTKNLLLGWLVRPTVNDALRFWSVERLKRFKWDRHTLPVNCLLWSESIHRGVPHKHLSQPLCVVSSNGSGNPLRGGSDFFA